MSEQPSGAGCLFWIIAAPLCVVLALVTPLWVAVLVYVVISVVVWLGLKVIRFLESRVDRKEEGAS